MPQLTNQHSQIKHHLPDATFTIGRGADNDLVIYDPTVSLHHCRISFVDDSHVLEDLGSKNGIRVNGQLVRHQLLHHQDLLKIGNSLFCYDGLTKERHVDPNYLRFISGRRNGEVMSIPNSGLKLGNDAEQVVLIFKYADQHYLRTLFCHPRKPLPTVNGEAVDLTPKPLRSGDQISLLMQQFQFCGPRSGWEYTGAKVAITTVADDRHDHRICELALEA
ncbi:MAG: FHA domain-containing protein [Gammaproteobacteria bacterium]|nr:FHA domain-containing protein [Gammaproteobacteria bacterium]